MCEIDPITLEKYSETIEKNKAKQLESDNARTKVFFRKNTGNAKLN
jgi:hypothetical protein